MAIKASNQITITDITDAYSVFMDNEAYAFMATNAGGISGSCVANIRAICGSDDVTVSVTQANIKFYEQGSSSEMSTPPFTVTVTPGTGNLSTTITFTAKSNATLTVPIDAVIPISVDSTVTVNKRFTLSAAKTGAAGAAGAKWYQGSGTPSSGTGANGDYYLNTANGDVYQKVSGSWTSVGNIKGGTGAAGADGSKWSSGTALSGTSGSITGFAGSVNDQYLNTSTGNTYKCITAGTSSTAVWNYTGNIKGADGDDGEDAIVIDITPTGPTVFKKNTDNVKLTPSVRVGMTAIALTAGANGATCSIGGVTYTLKWYKGSTNITTTVTANSIVAEKSGNNFTGSMTLYGAAITNAELIKCTLEA